MRLDAANLFMSECAVKGYPFPDNLTLSIPSWFDKQDHFPEQFVYHDYMTPVDLRAGGVAISGFYGWGSFLAWNFALLSAALSGLRSSSRTPRQRRVMPEVSTARRVLLWVKMIFSYIRRDAELIAALAIPCIAVADLQHRRDRVSFHQLFNYDQEPSFVPAIYGEEAATDILTIRAAIVILNHFLILAPTLALLPVAARLLVIIQREPGGLGGRQGTLRHMLRTSMILIASVWHTTAVKPVYCTDPFESGDRWYGGCKSTNEFLWITSKLATVIGPPCGLDWVQFAAISISVVSILGMPLAYLDRDMVTTITSEHGNIAVHPWLHSQPGSVLLLVFVASVFVFIICPIAIFCMFSFHFVGFLIIWPFTTTGRKCTFGQTLDMIGLGEMDQIISLAVGAALGVTSIWDSISGFVKEVRNVGDSGEAGVHEVGLPSGVV